MTKSPALSLMFLLGLVLSGCASKGFVREELVKEASVSKPVFDDKDIQAAYQKKSNLPKPFKLAYFFKSPTAFRVEKGSWRWTDADRSAIEKAFQEMVAKGLISEAVPLAKALAETEDLKSLRMAAARYQADALLIIGGGGEIDRYTNNWAWSYILLAPALFVKGSESETLFLSAATLWDVKNEFLYMAAEGEGRYKETYAPAFGMRDQDLIENAKQESIKDLTAKIASLIAAKSK